jgi:SAM-dependent methyltransferase
MREYDRGDAAMYDYYSTGVEGDVEFYVDEAEKAGSPVLELGCGTGRILIPVAKAGVEIVGLDRAPSMLAVARRKLAKLAAGVRRRVQLVEDDMRTFSLGRRFSLVMVPYRAFLHLLTLEDQRQALARIKDHLNDGGRLVLNVFDPALPMIAARLGHHGGVLRKDTVFRHPETGREVVVWESFRYDATRQVLEGEFIFEELDADGRVVAKSYAPLALRWIYRYEMQHLLEASGFRIEALYGDFSRGPFVHGGEQIWIARHR